MGEGLERPVLCNGQHAKRAAAVIRGNQEIPSWIERLMHAIDAACRRLAKQANFAGFDVDGEGARIFAIAMHRIKDITPAVTDKEGRIDKAVGVIRNRPQAGLQIYSIDAYPIAVGLALFGGETADER